jgi:hypothetical protein
MSYSLFKGLPSKPGEFLHQIEIKSANEMVTKVHHQEKSKAFSVSHHHQASSLCSLWKI